MCVAIGVAAAVLTRACGMHVLWLWLSILCLGAMHGVAWYVREPAGWKLILVIAIAAPLLAALGIGTLAGLVPERGYRPDPDSRSDPAGGATARCSPDPARARPLPTAATCARAAA